MALQGVPFGADLEGCPRVCAKPRRQPERLVEACGLTGNLCRLGRTGNRDELSGQFKVWTQSPRGDMNGDLIKLARVG